MKNATQDHAADELRRNSTAFWTRRYGLLYILWLGFSFLAVLVLEHFSLNTGERVIVVVVPTVFLLLCIRSYIRSTRLQLDELQLRIQLEALAFAFWGAVVAAELWDPVYRANFFQGAEFWNEMWQAWRFWLLVFTLYGLGYWVARRRYR